MDMVQWDAAQLFVNRATQLVLFGRSTYACNDSQIWEREQGAAVLQRI